MPIIRNIIQPIIRPIISGIIGAIRRVFITLDPVANAYYELAESWTATTDYSVEFDIYFNGEVIRATGNTANFFNRVIVNANGSVSWRATFTSTDLVSPASSVPSNKLSKIKVERIGSQGFIYVNGVEVTTGVVPTTGVFINNFGSQGGSYNGGLISNVKLTDLTTPSNSESYALNQLTGNIEYPAENVFGSELVVNGDFDSGATGWTAAVGWTISTGEASAIGAGTTDDIRPTPNIGMVTGEVYLFTLVISELTAGKCQIAIYDGASGSSPAYDTAGTYQFAYKAVRDNDALGVRGSNATPFTGTIDSISVKQITNALTYVNIAETIDVRDTYTLVDEGWVGSELITQDIWENPQNTPAAIFTYEPATNTWLMTGDGGPASLVCIRTTDQPESMLVAGELEIISGSGVLVFSAASAAITQSGAYRQTGTKAINSGQGFNRSSGVVDARFSKYSLKQLIEVA